MLVSFIKVLLKRNIARIKIQISAMSVKTLEIINMACVLLYNASSVIPLAIILEVIKVEHPATIKTHTRIIVNNLFFIVLFMSAPIPSNFITHLMLSLIAV